MTRRVSWLGVEAPLVTPTFRTPLSHATVNLPEPAHKFRGLGAVFLAPLDEPWRVRWARAADDDHDVIVWGGLHRRFLALLRRAADLVVDLRLRVPRLDPADEVLGIPDRERRLAGDRDTVAGQNESFDVIRFLNEVDAARRLADDPFRFRMPFATDVDDLVTLVREVRHQLMRADDVRARRVDRLEAQLDCPLLDLRRHAVRREDDGAVLDVLQPRKAVGLVHKRDALFLQVVCGMGVVNEHAEHVDRALGLFAYSLRDPKRVHHAVAVAPRRDLHDFHVDPSLREMISPTMAVAAAGSTTSERGE